MSAKYSLLPIYEPETDQPKSLFQATSFIDPKISAYSSDDFKSIFTYKSAFGEDRRSEKFQDQDATKQSFCCWCCAGILTVLCCIVIFITAPISLWLSLKMVQEYERLIIFRLGHMLPIRGPGLTMIFPCIDRIHKVDLRLRAFSVPPQQILTSDGGAIELGAEIYLRVSDPVQCVLNVQDMDKSTRAIALTTLQKLMRKFATDEIDLNRARICEEMMKEINILTTGWGVEIQRVEISPIKVLVQPTKTPGALSNVYNALSSAFFGGNSSSILPPLPGMVPPTLPSYTSTTSVPVPSNSAHVNPRHLLTIIHRHLSVEMVQQFGCVYKFNLHGTDGGQFYLDLKNGMGSAGEGEPPGGDCDVALTLSVQDMYEILTGKVSAFNAYMSGRIEVNGDLRTALRLANITSFLQGSI